MKTRGWFAAVLETKSLKFQILSRTLLVMSALLLLIGVFQYVFMQQFMFQNKAETIRNQLAALPPNVWLRAELGGDKSTSPFLPRQDFMRNNRQDNFGEGPRIFVPDLTIALIDDKGTYKLVSSQDEQSTLELDKEEYVRILQKRTKKQEHLIMKDSKGNEQLIVFHQIGGGEPDRSRGYQGLIQASTSTAPIKDVLLRQLLTFLFLSMLAMVIGLLGFLPVLRRTLVPLSNLVDTVKSIDSGNLNERFPDHQGQAEMDRLATSFNSMLERLEFSFEAEKEAKEQMRRFAADASHELRTPLTSIHGFLEVLLRGAYQQPEPLLKALKSMHGESVRINKLVEDLLLLARLDRTPSFHKTEVAMDDVLHEMEHQLRLLAGERGVTFLLEPETLCHCDPDKIKQVILNLFHNAVQHTHPETGEVRVLLTKTDAGVEIAVRDNGPGIAPEHIAHLFDRFYRIDSSRARRSGGAGLGLSITRSIVELHGGSIHVESSVGEGSAFIVRLPG
ncbi:Adaptive-response sensory-kinase SasA [Paenibacillus allorhizoplanae]|uniref:histidine kinase n=1 Tax=Paenibacillus allorhizoplanae TaxID=2905648 RepID=A0ABM9CAE4_9BACL|nr:HAMP domain-containing sensor histidine kinase [Paenibacillus allorhizoplanae]CAH1206389.1 Adaptive-response sensory-kinase SasA [Paenibacillus allorhizoplanae]